MIGKERREGGRWRQKKKKVNGDGRLTRRKEGRKEEAEGESKREREG